jgi:hypothetical protein
VGATRLNTNFADRYPPGERAKRLAPAADRAGRKGQQRIGMLVFEAGVPI